MGTLIEINDDFDPEKICASGQCFRAVSHKGRYRFVTKDRVLYIRRAGEDGDLSGGGAGRFEVSCSRDVWERVWAPYFDLTRSYRAIRSRVPESDGFMRRAAESGKGIRILRQDPWEMTISFIISQRKNIPSIRQAVERLAERYGRPVRTEYGTVFLFPEPEKLARVSEEEFRECRLGYRASYVKDAAVRVSSGRIRLEDAQKLNDRELIDYFRQIRGVGEKVARCIGLFAYGRTKIVPVDTWIAKVVEQEYGGENPFSRYGGDAGVFQQYAFYYAQHAKGLGIRRSAP